MPFPQQTIVRILRGTDARFCWISHHPPLRKVWIESRGRVYTKHTEHCRALVRSPKPTYPRAACIYCRYNTEYMLSGTRIGARRTVPTLQRTIQQFGFLVRAGWSSAEAFSGAVPTRTSSRLSGGRRRGSSNLRCASLLPLVVGRVCVGFSDLNHTVPITTTVQRPPVLQAGYLIVGERSAWGDGWMDGWMGWRAG